MRSPGWTHSVVTVSSYRDRVLTAGSPYTPTVSPLLTSVAPHNLLLLRSLPDSILYRQANVRRRKDEHRVGTATRGFVERLYGVLRRVQSDARPTGRVRHALPTGAQDRGRPAPVWWKKSADHTQLKSRRLSVILQIKPHGFLHIVSHTGESQRGS